MLIADIILCIIKAAISIAFAQKLCAKKCSLPAAALLALFCGGVDFAAGLLSLWLRCIVSLAALIPVCCAFLKSNLNRAVSSAITCVYLRTAAELLVCCTMFAITREDYTAVMNGTVFNHALFGLIAAAIYCGLMYLVWYILSQQPQETFSQAWRHYFFVMGVFLLLAAAFGSLFCFSESNVKIAPLVAAVAVLFVAMCIAVVNFFAEICAGYAREKQLHHLRSDYCSVKEQLEVQNQTSQRLRKIRHDIKNHLNSVSALLDKGEQQKARELLREISNTADSIQPTLSQATGNSLIDAVIAYKAALGEIRKIPFEYSLEILPEIRIDLSDVSSVIANLLDNALEAAEKAKDPYVEIRVFMYKDYLTIMVKNSFHCVTRSSDGQIRTEKSDRENHGLGMTIVSEICERNFGVFRYKTNGAWFSASAMLRNR